MPDSAQSRQAREAMLAARRRIAFKFILATAVCGAIVSVATERGTWLHDFGTLMVLMWIPVISYAVLYLAKKRRPLVAEPPEFAPGDPFHPHVRVEITNQTDAPDLPAVVFDFSRRYFLVLGTEGFSVRLHPLEAPLQFDAQFLVPALAAARFEAGTQFRVFDGKQVIAQGVVQQTLGPAS